MRNKYNSAHCLKDKERGIIKGSHGTHPQQGRNFWMVSKKWDE